MTVPQSELVFGFHPTTRGFGWTLFDGPAALDDSGIAYVRGDKVSGCARRLAYLLDLHRPDILVLERFDPRIRAGASRPGDVSRAAIDIAERFGVRVVIYGRPEVRKALGLDRDATREKVAAAVAESTPVLAHSLPGKRRPWDSLDRRTAMFTAAALALTHYQGQPRLFERDSIVHGPIIEGNSPDRM